jgi:hypothetical protein
MEVNMSVTKTEMSNSVHTARFWNNLHQVIWLPVFHVKLLMVLQNQNHRNVLQKKGRSCFTSGMCDDVRCKQSMA